MSSVGVHIKYP